MNRIHISSTLLCALLFSNCASTPKQGYSSKFNSNTNQSNHQYCQDQSCILAECTGERLTEECHFEGQEILKTKLMENSKFFEEKIKNATSLWVKYCSPPTSDPKIICHEGETKIEKPKASEVVNSSEESLIKFENGKKHVIYKEVYILNP